MRGLDELLMLVIEGQFILVMMLKFGLYRHAISVVLGRVETHLEPLSKHSTCLVNGLNQEVHI